jgi:hypothetical protein
LRSYFPVHCCFGSWEIFESETLLVCISKGEIAIHAAVPMQPASLPRFLQLQVRDHGKLSRAWNEAWRRR